MTSEETLTVVRTWFESVGAASLELPNGWFGRPYDSSHELTWSTARDEKIFIELDDQIHLILTDPSLTRSKRLDLEIQVSALIFDWRDRDPDGDSINRRFPRGGNVGFHVLEVTPKSP
jgi:hypothetical protein